MSHNTNEGDLQRLALELSRMVKELPYEALLRVACKLLRRSGFSGVALAGRRALKGRTHHGGLDLMACQSTDLQNTLTLIQVKNYCRPVSRRFVDELRGTMLRLGASHGLLITTSTFSRAAHKAISLKVAPITLIDGTTLIDELLSHRIGIRKDRQGKWQVDYKWFFTLRRASEQFSLKTQVGSARNREPQSREAQSDEPHSREAQSCERGAHSSQGRATISGASDAETGQSQGRDEQSGEEGGMRWSTHLLLGLDSLWVLTPVVHSSVLHSSVLHSSAVHSSAPPIPLILAAGLGSLLPDLDAAESKLKHLSLFGVKPFLLPGHVLHRMLGHRGVMHSLLGLILVAALAAALSPWTRWEPAWEPALALALGYASHLVADAATRAGIPLLFPRRQRFHLLPPSLRIRTGSEVEDLVFVGAALALLWFLLHSLSFV